MKLRGTILIIILSIALSLFLNIGKISAQIDVSVPLINFGVLKRPQSKTLSVMIKNTAASPFLGTISADKTWIVPAPQDISLASGSSTEIKLTLDSAAIDPGEYEASVSFRDFMGTSKAVVKVKCVVIVGKNEPILKLREKEVDFKEIERGGQAMGIFWVENVGSGLLKGKLTCPDWIRHRGPASFQIYFTQAYPVYLDAFAHDFFPGEYTGEVKVESNGGNLSIPVSIRVKPKKDDPILGFEPKEMDFGTVKKGKKGRKKLKICNKGKGKLTGTIIYPEWIEGDEEFKEIEKELSILFVADTGKLPYGITKAVVKLTSDAGILDVPVRIFVESR